MSTADEARAEAFGRYHQWDSGYRDAFIAGAEWQASRPITDAQIEAASKAYWGTPGRAAEAEAMRAALEAARGADRG